MAITYLKKSPKTSSTDDTKTTGIVQDLLKNIETTKEQGCIDLTKKFDKYDGEIIVSKERIEEIKKTLDQKTKDDVQFSYERVRKFAEAQLKNYGQDFEVELSDGLFAGQKLVPVNTAGCYVPGGRYAHIASAVMSVTTAKVAGVKNVIACSPPKEGVGAHPTIIYTADLCGADVILNLGGVPAIAAMTNGLFNNPAADIIVGPGNQFVAEAKRILFGKVGIDLFAGPTEIGIIADAKADPEIVAVDLVGQAEHGYNSPCWLYTTSKELGEKVMKRVPELIAELPEVPRTNADVFGPLAFDNSISKKSAAIKGVKNIVAGDADVLLVPSVETGNSLVKMMIYFMGACAAGVVVGGKVPIVITSRSDEAQARLASIAAAVVALD